MFSTRGAHKLKAEPLETVERFKQLVHPTRTDGLVFVDEKGVLKKPTDTLCGVAGQNRRFAHCGTHAWSSQGLVQMHATYVGSELPVFVYTPTYVVDGVILGRQIEIRVHEMPGVKHHTPIGVSHLIHESRCDFGTRELEPTLPKVLHKQGN